MTYLLDVNVLIALTDPRHVAHGVARRWFDDVGSASFATCPITENGLVRILGNPRYPNAVGSLQSVVDTLKAFRGMPGHVFWADDISIADRRIDTAKLATSAQVTDTYLLALASAHGGQLATLDRRLSALAVDDGRSTLHVLGA